MRQESTAHACTGARIASQTRARPVLQVSLACVSFSLIAACFSRSFLFSSAVRRSGFWSSSCCKCGHRRHAHGDMRQCTHTSRAPGTARRGTQFGWPMLKSMSARQCSSAMQDTRQATFRSGSREDESKNEVMPWIVCRTAGTSGWRRRGLQAGPTGRREEQGASEPGECVRVRARARARGRENLGHNVAARVAAAVLAAQQRRTRVTRCRHRRGVAGRAGGTRRERCESAPGAPQRAGTRARAPPAIVERDRPVTPGHAARGSVLATGAGGRRPKPFTPPWRYRASPVSYSATRTLSLSSQ